MRKCCEVKVICGPDGSRALAPQRSVSQALCYCSSYVAAKARTSKESSGAGFAGRNVTRDQRGF
jgi:hypothetical protein